MHIMPPEVGRRPDGFSFSQTVAHCYGIVESGWNSDRGILNNAI
jgi:hypothetical protein